MTPVTPDLSKLFAGSGEERAELPPDLEWLRTRKHAVTRKPGGFAIEVVLANGAKLACFDADFERAAAKARKLARDAGDDR